MTDTPIKAYQRAIGNAAASYDRAVMSAHVKHTRDGEGAAYMVAEIDAFLELESAREAAGRAYSDARYAELAAEEVGLEQAKELIWPAGCHSPSSCSRNKRCMYMGCHYEGKEISG